MPCFFFLSQPKKKSRYAHRSVVAGLAAINPGFALVYGGTLLVRHYVKKHRARKAARRETAARTEAWVNAVDPESTWVIDFEITITGGVIVDTSVTITDLVGLGYRGT